MGIGVVEIQCFRGKNNEFVVKELAISSPSQQCMHHYFFLPPYDIEELSDKNYETAQYLTNSLHGLTWESGEVSYDSLPIILKALCEKFSIIFTKGQEKSLFLSKLLNRSVKNLDTVLLKKIDLLPQPDFICRHDGTCARKNVLKICNWIINTFNFFELL